MSGDHTLARKHLDALLEEAKTAGIPVDVIGRALLNEVVETWLEERSWNDVADELHFTASCLDPDKDFEFMRP